MTSSNVLPDPRTVGALAPSRSSHAFDIITAPRLDLLMTRLAGDLRAAPLPPLRDETVVVQSQGMERWVRLELARRHGCAASLSLPFPAAFCRRVADSVEGVAPGESALDPRFSRDALTWRIHSLLDGPLTSEPAFTPLEKFVRGRDARHRMGLAAAIAARFDDYQLYRPDVLLAWEGGGVGELGEAAANPSVQWQAELWRRLCGGESPRHLGRRFVTLIDALERASVAPDGLPERVAVFGVSSLPPIFIRLLHATARFVPVRAYVVAPPRSTWASDVANPLFVGLGSQLREYLGLLGEGARSWEELDSPLPDETARPRVLHTLQADVRAGVARGASPPALALDPADDSLLVHDCHSPLREMEVVRDQLLASFAADPTLRPHDVLVLVPDADAYAPYVEAVFGAPEDGVPRIPFHIADRSIVREHSLVGALLQLLSLPGGRKTVAEVTSLLDTPAARRAAGLDEADVATVLGWVRETRIRWGRDAAERADVFALPRLGAHSWRDGVDRLLMGYAAGDVDAFVADVLPHAGHTVGDPRLLGRFAEWIDRLFATLDSWREPRSLDAWASALGGAVNDFFEADGEEEERSLDLLRTQLVTLGDVQLHSACDEVVDITLVRDWLAETLADGSFGTGFLSGGMTFCALKPMRSVPFRVIAVSGLDNGTFPRRGRRVAFDLQALAPRVGDRDLRADDRQLFLDVILAAGDRLILTHVGRSARDNKDRAPSVVLSELLDVVARSFGSGDVAEPLVVRHRLQPFSDAYYRTDADADARLFSYSGAGARANEVSSGERRAAEPFITEPLPSVDAKVETIALADLIECWSNPSRFFCKRVLDVHLETGDVGDDDAEPLAMDGLASYGVRDRMVRAHLARTRASRDEEHAQLAARGDLPPAALGRAFYEQIDESITALLARIGTPTFLEPVVVSARGDGWEVTGRADGLTDAERVQVRPGKLKAKDLVRAWITHLALNAHEPAAGEAVPTTTRVLALDEVRVFPAVPDAAAQLAELVRGYREACRAPLPVFERASLAYAEQAEKLRNPKSRATKEPLEVAWEAYHEANEWGNGADPDRANAYVALCFRGRTPFAEDEVASFERWSNVLWARAVSCATTEKA